MSLVILGYEGENCEMDIDECAEQPCENDGECFERSDTSHWEMDWEFRFADAAGYLCQCQPGFAGETQSNERRGFLLMLNRSKFKVGYFFELFWPFHTDKK